MKNLYATLLLVFCSFAAGSQNLNIPDTAFKSYLLTYPTVDTNIDEDDYPDAMLDTNHDGEIQASEAEAVTNLTIYGSYHIYETIGIEAFVNLKSLNCQAPITSAAISTFTNLEVLDISSSYAGHVFSLSGLQHLKTFICSGSHITTLHLSGLPSLETLGCSGNLMTALDCSALPSLKNLNCSNNQITSLNLSGLVNLENLDCGYNPFTSMNLSDNVNLKMLNCPRYLGTSIDLSHQTNLETLSIQSSELTSLDLSHLTSMTMLNCEHSSYLNILNISNLPALRFVYCYSGNITAINSSGSNNIEEILCNRNQITTLDVSHMPHLDRLWCDNNQLTALNIAGTALTDLNCSVNQLNALDVANLTGLQYLNCNTNQIAALEVSNLVNMANLDCGNNNISQLNTTALVNLGALDFSMNDISEIDLANINDLHNLYCNDNNLTSINIAHLTNLESFNCANNQLTELNMPTTNSIDYQSHNPPRARFNCSGNLFTTLDFTTINCNSVYTYFENNPNLTQVNLKNSNCYYQVFAMQNCPNLTYICINDFTYGNYGGVFNYIEDQSLLDNIQINTYCSFNPGGDYNTIAGKFTFDLDNNGCDANDYHSVNNKIQIDDHTTTGATFTNASGDYSFYTRAGNFVISPLFENPYFTVSPASATINFATNDSSTQTQNFCVIPNGVHNDVEITLLPIAAARPGFDCLYKLVYKNKGNQILSGSINLTFEDAILDFVSAEPALSNQSLNTLTWSYSDLRPFESKSISLALNLNSPMETPAVNIDDVLHFSATIDPVAGDETVDDNTSAITQTVLGSFDPNDKTCLEGDTLTTEMIGNYLHYMIRFQNSGTAAAENIVVRDIIDTNKFDMSSLELTDSSHSQVTKITDNKVEFQFANINLPAEINDEPGSHGYVIFKIRTKGNLAVGDSVENKADIYFDYNFPIETNTATSTVVPLMAVNAFENNSIVIAPNPTKNRVQITSKDNITSVQLFDVQGRILETLNASKTQAELDLSQKNTGVYFVKIQTVKGMKVQKIIKE